MDDKRKSVRPAANGPRSSRPPIFGAANQSFPHSARKGKKLALTLVRLEMCVEINWEIHKIAASLLTETVCVS